MRATFGAVVGNVSTGVGEGVTTFTVTDGWHRNRHGHSDIDGSRQRWRCRDEAEYAGQSTARYISSTAGLEAGGTLMRGRSARAQLDRDHRRRIRAQSDDTARAAVDGQAGAARAVTTLLPGRKLLPRYNPDPSLTNHR